MPTKKFIEAQLCARKQAGESLDVKSDKEFNNCLIDAYTHSGMDFSVAWNYFRRDYFPIRKEFLWSEYERLNLAFEAKPSFNHREKKTYQLTRYVNRKATQAMIKYLYELCEGDFLELKQTLAGENFKVETEALKKILNRIGLTVKYVDKHVHTIHVIPDDEIPVAENVMVVLDEVPKEIKIKDDPKVDGDLQDVLEH